MPPLQHLSLALRIIRGTRNQQTFARDTGIPPSTLARIDKGLDLTLTTFLAVSRAVAVDPNTLLGYSVADWTPRRKRRQTKPKPE